MDGHIPAVNRDQAGGAGRNIKGRLKEAAGIVSGSKKLEADGLADRVVGAAKYVVGGAKQAVGTARRGAAKKLGG
jgi:uncharacterized protein YjbJ (UPF0337 family)